MKDVEGIEFASLALKTTSKVIDKCVLRGDYARAATLAKMARRMAADIIDEAEKQEKEGD